MSNSLRRQAYYWALAAGLVPSMSVFGTLTTTTQTFDTDPGWLREGIPNNVEVVPGNGSSNFGFSNTDNTGTTPNPPGGVASGAGEAGGVVATVVCASYGDNVGAAGALTLDDPLSVSGIFNIATANQDSMFGFYNSAAISNIANEQLNGMTPPPSFLPQTLGIETTGRGTVFDGANTQTIRIHMGGTGTQTIAAQIRSNVFNGDTSTSPVLTGNSYPFTFTYSPTGGANSSGFITLQIGGVLSTQGSDTATISLTAAQRASGITFDRLGIIPNVIRTGGGPETVWYDDLTYTTNSNSVVSIPGDANHDGHVNTLDFNILASAFNQTTSLVWANGDITADFNGDGRINALDFNILATNFGMGGLAPALGQLIPEPSSIGLIGLVAAMAVRRRRLGNECLT